MITVAAYSKIKKVNIPLELWDKDEEYVMFGLADQNKQLCVGFDDQGTYDYAHTYEVMFSMDEYDDFLEELAKMLGYPKLNNSYREGALYTVAGDFRHIFSINDGVFTVVNTHYCKKFYDTFTDNVESVKHSMSDQSKEIYKTMTSLFSLAADDGCVVFE